MSENGGPPEDKGVETPAWIVSFADMTTLLLAFFVLLQSFAKEQNPELFYQGQGAFRRAIAGMGIPDTLFGKEKKIKGKTREKRYPTKEDKKNITRSEALEVENENIRLAFQRLKQDTQVETSDTQAKQIGLISTPVTFEPSDATLDTKAKKYLSGLALTLKQSLDKDAIKIYIIGSASDVPDGPGQWSCSVRRAKATTDFLTKALSNETYERSWSLIPWGAGGEKERRLRRGASTRQEFIRIVIIEVE